MIVSRLEPDPRRRSATRVLVDGRVAWSVPTQLVVELGLAPGLLLSMEAIDALEQGADTEAALRAGLRSLERRAHSRQELGLKLTRKGHPPASVELALDHLAELGLLDDAAFARDFVSSRLERGRGPARLRHDLLRLGVAEPLIERALHEVLKEQGRDPLEQLHALARKRAGQLRDFPPVVRRRRLTAFLMRRGYQGEACRKILEEVLGDLGSD